MRRGSDRDFSSIAIFLSSICHFVSSQQANKKLTLLVLPCHTNTAGQVHAIAAARAARGRRSVDQRRVNLERLSAVYAAASAGDRTDGAPADAEPGGNLALRQLAVLEQTIDLIDQCRWKHVAIRQMRGMRRDKCVAYSSVSSGQKSP
jgi:hypothetical protein